MTQTQLKLKLEAIYSEYCNNDLNGMSDPNTTWTDDDEKEAIEMMKLFVKVRLKASGGDKYTYSLSMNNVENFLNEICLYDDMMADAMGEYRGSFCWECLDHLTILLNESDLDDVIKNEIIEGYRLKCRMDEE